MNEPAYLKFVLGLKPWQPWHIVVDTPHLRAYLPDTDNGKATAERTRVAIGNAMRRGTPIPEHPNCRCVVTPLSDVGIPTSRFRRLWKLFFP